MNVDLQAAALDVGPERSLVSFLTRMLQISRASGSGAAAAIEIRTDVPNDAPPLPSTGGMLPDHMGNLVDVRA